MCETHLTVFPNMPRANGQPSRCAPPIATSTVSNARLHGASPSWARILPLDAHFAIGNFIRDAMRGISIEVNGDGTAKRSYMYAADLAIWLWTILLRGPANQVFNVGSDQAISILKLAHAVAAAIGSPAAIRVAQRAAAEAEAQQYVPSISKAQQDLGLRCEVALEDAIRRTAAWHGYSDGPDMIAHYAFGQQQGSHIGRSGTRVSCQPAVIHRYESILQRRCHGLCIA